MEEASQLVSCHWCVTGFSLTSCRETAGVWTGCYCTKQWLEASVGPLPSTCSISLTSVRTSHIKLIQKLTFTTVLYFLGHNIHVTCSMTQPLWRLLPVFNVGIGFYFCINIPSMMCYIVNLSVISNYSDNTLYVWYYRDEIPLEEVSTKLSQGLATESVFPDSTYLSSTKAEICKIMKQRYTCVFLCNDAS